MGCKSCSMKRAERQAKRIQIAKERAEEERLAKERAENSNWKKVKYLKTYDLILPKPLADWDVFDHWERERTESIANEMKPDEVLYDVGAESGWLSAVYAKHCKVFLIEPTKEYWSNIKQIMERNGSKPVGCYCGLIGPDDIGEEVSFDYPEATNEMVEGLKYEYIHQHTEGTHMMRLDTLIEKSGIKPDGITIDTEGSEALILLSCERTLLLNRPKVWVSIHPDLMEKNNYPKKETIFELMAKNKYEAHHLATDHEEHWYFKPL